jgi:hypothetical protein
MANKELDPEDPMAFVGVGMECDEKNFNEMVETIIEEFMLLGWPDSTILEMFRQPFYQFPHSILRLKGEPYVMATILRVRKAWNPTI